MNRITVLAALCGIVTFAGPVAAGDMDAVIRACDDDSTPAGTGSPQALFCKGLFTVDDAEAHAVYMAAAAQGYAPAQYYAAYDFREGIGVTKDIGQAMPLFLKAAEQGLADAQNDYAFQYFYGKNGIEADPEKAVPWLRKAADQGYAHAQTLLAEAYYKGRGVEQDYAEAFRLYQAPAATGHLFAQYMLGTMYADGLGTGADNAQAAVWLEKAGRQGSKPAQKTLAGLYKDSLNDPFNALVWYEVYAANKGVERPTEIDTLATALSADQVFAARKEAATIRGAFQK